MGLAALLLAAAAASLLWPPQPPRVTNVRPLTGGLDTTPDITVAWPSWATDGVRLYCLASKGGEPALFQIPATGGETVAGPLPFRYRNAIHGYLPGESALLMSGDDISQEWSWAESVPLWVVPVPAGAPSRVGNFVGWAAAASPDGRRVAAVNVKDGTITVARRDGSIEQVLGPFPIHTALSLTWSPDGRRLRYTAPGSESSSSWIWETTLDGGTPRPLWRGSSGRWSGDGRHFLFQRWNDDEHRSDLHAVREDYPSWVRTPEPVRLTSGPMSFSVPGTSPDGRRLFAFGTSSQAEVLRWEPATGRFEPYLGGFSARAVDASRDGGWVAWVSHPERTLWRSRSDGTDRLRLTGSGWAPSLPRWSPDGRSLVFIASNTPEESRGSLYLIPRDGGRPELLVRSDTGDDNPWDPCWLPDGTAVLFSYIQRDHAGLYRVDRTTRQVSLLPGSEQFTFPKCSPRGDLLALQRPPSSSEAPGAYWVFRADRNSWEPVPDLHAGQFHNWSPDGGYIISLDPGTQRLTRWSRTTGDVEVFADVSGIRLLRTIALPWTGFAHDGSPLVIRDLSTRDLYALDWEAP
jgi:Tol biopolymer transport system component